jgi:lysophospholipase L1-like esterase
MKYLLIIVGMSLILARDCQAQTGGKDWKWCDPAAVGFPMIEGQAWPKELGSPYDRFPARASQTLNPNVWNISHSSAGLYCKFKTDAAEIVVRYTVQGKGSFAMSHMPATGVSGVDLYGLDHDGGWAWAPGTFSFGDTIEYHFSGVGTDTVFAGRDCEYRLFFPLYNTVTWMQIGVPAGKHFAALPLQPEKPIVVYGTSIAQGACASRPGLAWTAILERQLDRPLINLGFSGSGKLEKSVIDLMNEIDAELYVLDCLPNLSSGFSDREVESRIREAVRMLQEQHPSVPILLAGHSGGNAGHFIDTARRHEFQSVNGVLEKTFARMKMEGVRNIYLLTGKDIGLDINSTVDGVHPNDIGMEQYAAAYERSIRAILHEPVGTYATTRPVTQSRDGYYDWRGRHAEILSLNRTSPPANIILANSIIHYWGGEPKAPISRGEDSWNAYLQPLGVRNLGFGWDRIENVLWRIYHDELDGYKARHIVIMIGTNNLSTDGDEAIIAGLDMLVKAIRQRQPGARLLLSGLLPRRAMEQRIVVLNKAIAGLAGKEGITYIDSGKNLLNPEGKIDESLFGDGLHPNAEGYRRLVAGLLPFLKN